MKVQGALQVLDKVQVEDKKECCMAISVQIYTISVARKIVDIRVSSGTLSCGGVLGDCVG